MTKDEATALAFKREANKSKHQNNVRWVATHNSVKGWHVALEPIHKEVPNKEIGLGNIALAIAMFGQDATVDALARIMQERKA